MPCFISVGKIFYPYYAAVNKDELLQMVRYGADLVFSSEYISITDEDIGRIIVKGEEATTKLDAKMKKFTEDAIQFKMDDSKDMFFGCIQEVVKKKHKESTRQRRKVLRRSLVLKAWI